MKDKKLIISTIIGVAFLLVLIFGATYAYFTVTITDSFGTSKLEANIHNIGSVALKAKNNLSISLTASDMMNTGEDVVYYASKDGKTTTETTEIVGEATVQGPGLYSCNYTIELDDNESSMYDAFQNMSTKSAEQIVLTVNGQKMDFNTGTLFPKTIEGTMTNVSSVSPQYITAQLKIVNETDINQSALAGTNIEIGITIKNFKCTALPTENPVLAIQSDNLSNELVGGLFRFQGTAEEVTDNYFCIASNLDSCISNSEEYLRILGITPQGQIKLVMPPVLTSQWHDTETTGITWPNSYLFSQLKLIESANSNMLSAVENYNWKYGDLSQEDFGEMPESSYEEVIAYVTSMNADKFASVEGGWTNTIQSHLGLLYIHDFMYQKESGKCLSYDVEVNNFVYECADGWLTLPDVEAEWTMTSYSSTGTALAMVQGSMPSNVPITTSLPVRPVLYLKPGFNIIGKGTIDNPYRIS